MSSLLNKARLGAATSPKGEVILIVDDDEDILRCLGLGLRHLYQIHTCSESVLAVPKFLEIKPMAVILDIKMPQHDGFWVFREIRKHHEFVPIIFHSAYQNNFDGGDVEGVFKPFSFLSKPCSFKMIQEVLDQAVSQYREKMGEA